MEGRVKSPGWDETPIRSKSEVVVSPSPEAATPESPDRHTVDDPSAWAKLSAWQSPDPVRVLYSPYEGTESEPVTKPQPPCPLSMLFRSFHYRVIEALRQGTHVLMHHMGCTAPRKARLFFVPGEGKGGKGRLHWFYLSEQTDSELLIGVTNHGDTIPEGSLPFIFDRFYRADKSREHTNSVGAGLGLAITQSIIEAYGGTISAKSSDGFTEFWITFENIPLSLE